MIVISPQRAREVIRGINLTKLQIAYRVRFGPVGRGLEWLTMDDDAQVILTQEPDSTIYLRLQNLLLAPFVPEQQL